jgi:3-hydroxybutyryl-CoA dehydrogenase
VTGNPTSANIPTNVGVYGGGRMGAGIAHAFLLAGATVTVIEADDAAVTAAADRIHTSLAKAAERGKLAARRGWHRPGTSIPR